MSKLRLEVDFPNGFPQGPAQQAMTNALRGVIALAGASNLKIAPAEDPSWGEAPKPDILIAPAGMDVRALRMP